MQYDFVPFFCCWEEIRKEAELNGWTRETGKIEASFTWRLEGERWCVVLCDRAGCSGVNWHSHCGA